jgi:mono/diheme cytochrome c family protein
MTHPITSWLRRLAPLVLSLPLAGAWAASATFDGASGLLTLPDVKVGNTTYANVRLDVVAAANLTFRLRDAAVSPTAGTSNISFDPASGLLTIPEVTVGGDTYAATLAIIDAASFTFVLTSATKIAAAATLSQLQADVFTPRCSGCHSGAGTSLPGVLNLTGGSSFSNLVNVAARQNPGLVRVAPGDAANSYLVRKLEGSNTTGSRMPLGGPYLDADTLARIKSWIASGAPNN